MMLPRIQFRVFLTLPKQFKTSIQPLRLFSLRNSNNQRTLSRLFLTATALGGATSLVWMVKNKSKLVLAAEVLPYTATEISKMTFEAVTVESSLRDKNWMSDPITSVAQLEERKSEMRSRMELFIMGLQGKICKELEKVEEDKRFQVDKWSRPEGGGGVTCVIQDGMVFEKAGVNVSVVHGKLSKGAAAQMRSRGRTFKAEEPHFFACGISSVIHPRNPYVPTIHFNYRYFEILDDDGSVTSWFGGGTDLTPYIYNEDDFVHFHQTLKQACDKHDKQHYRNFKKWCDDYFHIIFRGERRGVGGIFFDDLETPTQEGAFDFLREAANAVLPSYVPLVLKHKHSGYSWSERQWQLLRRGRYVEFNLVYDRGTKFGLFTPGSRIESILMSLPLTARWEYNHEPEAGSAAAKLTRVLKNPVDWVEVEDVEVEGDVAAGAAA